jgi:arsenate reductase-like glutaredoxin family protein
MFSKIKGLGQTLGILEEDKDEQQQASSTRKPVSSVAAVAATAGDSAPPLVSPDNSPEMALDVLSVTKALDDMIRAAPEFAPFAAFETTLDSMKTVIPEEGMRFKAAQAASGSVSSKDLVDALAVHKSVLQRENDKFQQTVVHAAEEEVQAIGVEVEKLQQQADELTRQLGELSKRKDALLEESRLKTISAKKAAIDFAGIIESLEARYTNIAGLVQKHLGGSNAQ